MFYYPFGRLKSVLSPDGNSIGISYTAASDVSGGVMKVGASLASGEQVSTVFDVLGRSIATHSKLANGRFVVQKYPPGSGHLSKRVWLEDSGVRGNRWERRRPRAMALS